MPRFVAVYTMNQEDLKAFRARPLSEQREIDAKGLQAWEAWSARHAAALVSADVMVGRTRRVTKAGVAEAVNDIAGFVIVEAAHVEAAADLFRDHPHIIVFPGDGIDIMPVVSEPPNVDRR